jgi:tetratricopeptide (TPR) repeat protein
MIGGEIWQGSSIDIFNLADYVKSCVNSLRGNMERESLTTAKEILLTKEYAKALEIYERLIADDATNALAYEGAADCLNKLGRFDEAFSQSIKSTQLDNQLTKPYAIRAYVYLSKNAVEKALHEADVLIQLDPNSFETLQCYGTTLLFNHRIDDGIQMLEKALSINPKSIFCHVNLASSYYRKKNYSKNLVVCQT